MRCDVAKSINIKVFNLMSRINETRYASWHETCTCKWRLNVSVCNDKQRRNSDKGRYERKEFNDIGRYDDGFIPNSSICECDKSSDVPDHLDYQNCKCRKRLIDKLVQECSEDEILNRTSLNTTNPISITDKANCLIYIILLTIMSLILLSIICYYY